MTQRSGDHTASATQIPMMAAATMVTNMPKYSKPAVKHLVKLLFLALALPLCAQVAVVPITNPKVQFFCGSGVPCAGGFLKTFSAGTSTPLATYADLGVTVNPTSITLDANGRSPSGVFLQVGKSYKFELDDSTGAVQWTQDNVNGGNILQLSPPGAGLQTINGPLSLGSYGITFGSATLSSATLSSTGAFSNTQMNEFFQSLINGCNPKTEFNTVQGGSHNATDGMASCVTVPGTSTVYQVNGLGAYVRCNVANAGAGGSNCVAVYSQCIAGVNNASCWGGNPVAMDVAGLTTGVTLTHEFDTQPQNATSAYAAGGVQSNLFAPTSGTFPMNAYAATASQSGKWNAGFLCNVGATGNACVDMGANGTPNGSNGNFGSQALNIDSRYWTGSASATDTFQMAAAIGTGSPPSFVNLNLLHVGIASATFLIDHTVNFGLNNGSGNNQIIAPNASAPSGNSTIILPAAAGTLDLVPADGTFGSSQTRGASACETSFAASTLATGATTTDTGLSCLPANSVIDALVYRITTTITTAANFTIGDATTAGRFCGTQSTLTAGTTGVCFVQADQTGAGGPRQVSAAKVRVTTNINPGAGAIRLIVYYHTWTAPTS